MPMRQYCRVLLSTNGGMNWNTSYSNGLPNMPVNSLKYMQKGGRLFAGTDAGVFYRDKSMSKWELFNAGLPVCIVSDLEIDENANKIWASTFGRGMYSTDLDCIYKSDPLVIHRNWTWNHDTVVENSIFIDSSFTLTIRCKVELPPQSKIYVKQGAKLILDRGILTSHCKNMWQGIEVWGRSNIPQNFPYQGLVWIKNNSLVENARIGISTNNKTEGGIYCNSSTGGIITVTNSTFRNNYKAVEFLNYRHPNSSSFKQTTFETTGPFIDGESYPSDFVSLDAVNGIQFQGCTFINRTLTGDTIPDALKGSGIYSRDGTFRVGQYIYCPQPVTPCPNPKSVPSLFQGLHYGIKAINSNPSNLADIQKTRFQNNYRGIYLANMNYPVITQDTINIAGKSDGSSSDTCYGIYLDHCSSYTVQENRFISTYNPTQSGSFNNTIGIIVNHSGTDVNEIYNNNFHKVVFGIIAQNQNRDSYSSNGLCIKCNDFDTTKYDVIVNKMEGGNPDWGIAINQGWNLNPTDPAGNTFSKNHNNPSCYTDIDNEDAVFNYYHHFQTDPILYRVRPDYSNDSKVIKKSTIFPYVKSTVCHSKLSGGGGIGSEDEMKQQLTTQQQSVDSVSSILLALIDGGSTTSLTATIDNSSASDSYQLREQLLVNSPYLSDTVMKTAINNETALPNEMIRDILVANPHAPKSETVMDQLNNRNNPMPDSLLVEIQNGINLLGAKDSLETILYTHLQTKRDMFNKLVYFYQQDTLKSSASHDSLMALFASDHELSSWYQLAFEYLSNTDSLGIQNTLNNLPFAFNLSPEENALHQSYLSYFEVLNALADQGKSIKDISQEQVATLQSLIQNANEPVRTLARNVLIANNLCDYKEPIILPGETKSTKQKMNTKTGKNALPTYMKLFPNPTKRYIIVEYNLKDHYTAGTEGEIIITNMQGQQVFRKIIHKLQDQELIGTLSLSMGTYLCTLKFSNKVIETQRFVIVR